MNEIRSTIGGIARRVGLVIGAGFRTNVRSCTSRRRARKRQRYRPGRSSPRARGKLGIEAPVEDDEHLGAAVRALKVPGLDSSPAVEKLDADRLVFHVSEVGQTHQGLGLLDRRVPNVWAGAALPTAEDLWPLDRIAAHEYAVRRPVSALGMRLPFGGDAGKNSESDTDCNSEGDLARETPPTDGPQATMHLIEDHEHRHPPKHVQVRHIRGRSRRRIRIEQSARFDVLRNRRIERDQHRRGAEGRDLREQKAGEQAWPVPHRQARDNGENPSKMMSDAAC
jgi:hypothetical protein